MPLPSVSGRSFGLDGVGPSTDPVPFFFSTPSGNDGNMSFGRSLEKVIDAEPDFCPFAWTVGLNLRRES